jgi:hypothetical protein
MGAGFSPPKTIRQRRANPNAVHISVWSAATGRRFGKRVLATQRRLAAVLRRDQCLVSEAPWQSRQQAAGMGQHQAVESGDESPHSKRALQVLNLANWSKNYAALGGTPALHWTFLPGEQEFEIEIAHPVPGYLKYGYR